MWAGLFLFLSTFLILAAQFIFYLKDGVWPKWVLFSLVGSALPTPFLHWFASSKGWHGLHKIVAWILVEAPLWADALALVFICILGSVKIASSSDFSDYAVQADTPQTKSFKEPNIEASFSYRFGKRLGEWVRWRK